MRQKHSCLLVKRLYSYSQGPWEDKKCVVLLAVYCVQGSFAYWEHRVISKFSGPFGNCLIDLLIVYKCFHSCNAICSPYITLSGVLL